MEAENPFELIGTLKANLKKWTGMMKDELTSEQLEPRVLRQLNRLRKIDMTAELLESTKVGKLVNGLKKKWGAETQQLAKKLISSWRKIWRRRGEDAVASCRSEADKRKALDQKLKRALELTRETAHSRRIPFQRESSLQSPVLVDSAKNIRIPSLVKICTRLLGKNIHKFDSLQFEEVGVLPDFVLKEVLKGCSAAHLAQLESTAPYILPASDAFWEKHCRTTFSEYEVPESATSWRDTYMRLAEKNQVMIQECCEKMEREAQKSAAETKRRMKAMIIKKEDLEKIGKQNKGRRKKRGRSFTTNGHRSNVRKLVK